MARLGCLGLGLRMMVASSAPLPSRRLRLGGPVSPPLPPWFLLV
uniref:Uncharacterized protein n=2 Tax=Oryza sativa subsp. japonica TaxID=39947 RepID=Q10EX1_ORYSJ|nr:hypothetical protein [Oryza sativa Japonica Group]ABF98295.1 hypothetical protein LOC_Os03g48504 [Oryza sativa Japonica Group]